MNNNNLTIKNESEGLTVIDIEGTIGIPEQWQFDEPASRVATYDKFKQIVDIIRNIESGEVVVNIRSTGGNVNDAVLIYEALRSLPSTVTTRCYGYIASAATIIAQAAGEGRREISANSLYLVHNSQVSVEGNKSDMEQTADLLARTDQTIAGIYAARSGRPADTFVELMSVNGGAGRWMSAEEALSHGLVDTILPSAAIGNHEKEFVDYMGLPSVTDTPPGMPSEITDPADFPSHCDGTGSKSISIPADRAPDADASSITDSLRQEAGPTGTLPKEDPSFSEAVRRGNHYAYLEDIKNFKH